MSAPVYNHIEDIVRNHPHRVAIKREIVMSEDLNKVISRRTNAIFVYYQDEPVLRLSVDEAAWLAGALTAANSIALQGLQGVAE